MAHIFPFKAILPVNGKEALVSANIHVDSLNRQKEIVKENPLTYLNIVKPYLQFNEEKVPEKHFPHGRIAMSKLLENEIVKQSNEPSLYIYRQTIHSKQLTFLGLVCTVSVEDYFSGFIKKHENTLTEKEAQLIQHIEYTGVIGEPVLLTHFSNTDIKLKLESCLNLGELVSDFDDECGINHRVCKVNDPNIILEIQSIYVEIGNLYIADGHHRSAASAGYFHKNNLTNGKYLAYIVPPEYLKIDSFHRTYKGDGVFDVNKFLVDLSEDFELEMVQEPFVSKSEKQFGLCMNGQWWKLTFKHLLEDLDAVKQLDVSILEDYVFRKILMIQDSKSDKRLDFLRGSISAKEIQDNCVDSVFDCVFTVFPCNIQQVFDVSDNELIMPPKSTYIEPKMRTGLFIQDVNPNQ